jgi:hypothetical protein
VRPVLLALLLAAELTHFGLPVLTDIRADEGRWWWPIIWDGRPMVEALLGATLVTIFLKLVGLYR